MLVCCFDGLGLWAAVGEFCGLLFVGWRFIGVTGLGLTLVWGFCVRMDLGCLVWVSGLFQV